VFQKSHLIVAVVAIALGIILTVIKVVLAYFIMILIGGNLLGLVVRGFIWPYAFYESPKANDFLRKVLRESTRESLRMAVANNAITLLSLVLMAAYFFGIFHFWNVGLAATAGLLMVARLPDLLWEIRNGKKVSKANMPRGAVYFVATLIGWLCLPLTWYFLCKWPP
jgi:hypothetical protein